MMFRQAGTRANSRSELERRARSRAAPSGRRRGGGRTSPPASMIFPTVMERSPTAIAFFAWPPDDWRVTVTLHAEEHSGQARRVAAETEVEDDGAPALGERVIVGGGEDAGVVFLYTGTRGGGARGARRSSSGILAEHGLEADTRSTAGTRRRSAGSRRGWRCRRPRPSTRPSASSLEEDEVAESEELGEALWEVRIEFDSHRDAVAMADRLESEADDLLAGTRSP